MRKLLLPLAAALLLMPATSFAAPASVNDEGARVIDSGSVREIIIDDGDSIDGEVLSPDGHPIGGMRHKELESMITIRTQFINQLIKMSNDI